MGDCITLNSFCTSTELVIYLKLFVMLYADDTILLAESAIDLQKAIDDLHLYCEENKLINTTRTKVLVFSRGMIRNKPNITYGLVKFEVVNEYNYLGITFNYNGSVVKAKK